jgi:phosphoserine phosphatase
MLRILPFQSDWPGFKFICFDCDSTLSTIEGIDELARQKNKLAEVKRLTDAAMEGEVHLESVYDRRLQLLCPTRAEIRALAQAYQQGLVPDTREVFHTLKEANKEIFIISGGLLGAVRPFGEWLGLPPENIRAVNVRYNLLSGQWWDYQQDQWGQRPDVEYLDPEATPLIASHGKAEVVQSLLWGRAGRSLLVGDGMSDVAARPAVDLVVGFGGVVTRRHVLAAAEVFIQCNSLSPLLPLALSPPERAALASPLARQTLEKGLSLLETLEVIFKE